MDTIKRVVAITVISLTLALGTSTPVQAQCPMCKMAAESNLKNGGEAGKGLNNGILYMLGLPYVIIGTIGGVWYYNRRKEGEEDIEPA